MRLWHYEILPYLPNSQLWLISQWRELNSIFKNHPHHILINYVYQYPSDNLWAYTLLVLKEMVNRGIKIRKTDNFMECYPQYKENPDILAFHIKILEAFTKNQNPFPNHHTNRYLLQCYYNLQEKYDRGQKDFDEKRYERLEMFMQEQGVATII